MCDNRVGDYLYDKFNELIETELGLTVKSALETAPDQQTEHVFSKEGFRNILNGLFIMRGKRENIRSGCANIFDLSLRNFSDYQEYDGHSYVETLKGFGPVVQCVIDKHKEKFNARLRLNHFLKKIVLSPAHLPKSQLYEKSSIYSKYTNEKNKAILIITDATNPKDTKDLIVVCDHVVCTSSLGYLKENLNSLIEPFGVISDEKHLAVSRVGFGCISKVSANN